jgi:hypothetical protein
VGDAAYHGKPLLITGATITTRLPTNAVLFAPAPPRTGKRGRPRLKGHRLGTPAELATTAGWRRVTVTRYGRRNTVEVAEIPALWYGAFGNQPGRVVLVHDPGDTKILAIFTTDLDSALEHGVSRYAHRWPIETAIAAASNCRHRPGPQAPPTRGQTHRTLRVPRLQPRHRLAHAARHHPDNLTQRRATQPWYRDKNEPAFEDMLAKLRNPSRSTNYGRSRSSTRPPQIPRLRTGLRRRRPITAKLKFTSYAGWG